MGRSPCCFKEGLKKGPWTEEEDQKLIAFVKEHGHGNWRSLPKKCGLLRCGKSCRLRWTNYLRPDIKRGLFTHSEEQKIIQLHSLVGNKWAFIAAQLPKRTDNEIKNYWNTVLKKRLEKVGLLSLAGTSRTDSREAERQRHDNKSIKSSASKQQPPSRSNYNCDTQGNTICCPAVHMSYTHLAQWESARLEAEARLTKESQSSKTHKLHSFKYMGHSFSNSNNNTTTTTAACNFSSFPPPPPPPPPTTTTSTASAFPSFSHNIHTNPKTLQQLSNFLLNPPNSFHSSISTPSLIHHPPIINYLSSTSSFNLPINSLSNTSSCLSLPAIASMPSTPSNIVSSKALSRLSSQESVASALTLGSTGRLSWQTKELSFTTSPPISSACQSSFISQTLRKIDGHDHPSTKGDLHPGDLRAFKGNEQMNLEATSSIMDLNSTMENSMDLNSTVDDWHDLLFDVENNSPDVAVSTNWKDPIISSSQREEFTHDATSSSSKSGTIECSNVQGSLDLEGLNLLHFDSLMPCDHYANANQHSKELLWDTPTTLSVSSNSIVN